MKVFGYLFEAEGSEEEIEDSLEDAVLAYAAELGGRVVRFYRESERAFHRPLSERVAGSRLLAEIEDGDTIVAAKSSWILSSASDALRLIEELAARNISLYCLDLQENISLPQPRQLKVSEGVSVFIVQLLAALAKNENSARAHAVSVAEDKMKREGRYLSGPVPLEWRVEGAYLVEDTKQQWVIKEKRKREGADSPATEVLTETKTEPNLLPVGDSLKAYERLAMKNALEKCEGNRRCAAKILCISEASLYRKIKEYGLSNSAKQG